MFAHASAKRRETTGRDCSLRSPFRRLATLLERLLRKQVVSAARLQTRAMASSAPAAASNKCSRLSRRDTHPLILRKEKTEILRQNTSNTHGLPVERYRFADYVRNPRQWKLLSCDLSPTLRPHSCSRACAPFREVRSRDARLEVLGIGRGDRIRERNDPVRIRIRKRSEQNRVDHANLLHCLRPGRRS